MTPLAIILTGILTYVLGFCGAYMAARLGNETSNVGIRELLGRLSARVGHLEQHVRDLQKEIHP